jgi:hypothetical protein
VHEGNGNNFIIQYNFEHLYFPSNYVTLGTSMAVQSVTSDYQKTAGLKIVADKICKILYS